MTRFTKHIQLVALTQTKKSNGAYEQTKSSSYAFANKMTKGFTFSNNDAINGIRHDCSIQMRSSSYSNQEIVIMDSVEYDVDTVSDNGEFVTLSLIKRARND